jgi:[protein-PII] uridylyltransferase
MTEDRLLPLASADDVRAFARRLPVALDEQAFAELVLGFPRRYLDSTPGLEVLRHYALMNALGSRAVISSLARNESGYRLCVVARDRHFLFARIAGSLSCYGLDIVAAEAFANANDLVLDTFDCVDRHGRLDAQDERRALQALLESVVAEKTQLAPLLRERIPDFSTAIPGLELDFDDRAHPRATRLRLRARDRVALLYLVCHTISALGFDIEMAYVATAGGWAQDDFYLTRRDGRLSPLDQDALEAALFERATPPDHAARAAGSSASTSALLESSTR